MHKVARLLTFAATGLLFVGCDRQLTEPAAEPAGLEPHFAVILNETSEGLIWEPYLTCVDEVVSFVYSRHQVLRRTEDENGGLLVAYHADFHGIGVGLTSGTEYQMSYAYNRTRHVRPPFPHVWTYRYHGLYVAQGSEDNFMWERTGTLVIDADGNVRVDDPLEEVVNCRG